MIIPFEKGRWYLDKIPVFICPCRTQIADPVVVATRGGTYSMLISPRSKSFRDANAARSRADDGELGSREGGGRLAGEGDVLGRVQRHCDIGYSNSALP